MQQIYDLKDLVSQFADIPKKRLKRVNTSSGIENIVIYKTEDKIYKVTASAKDYQASNRIKDYNFKNVVKIYNTFVVKPDYPFNVIGCQLYIIEQERLYRFKHSNTFLQLNMIV